MMLILGAPGISFAQTPQAMARTSAQECDLENSLGAFLAIKDQASGRTTVQPTEEFRLQKTLLQKIIGCMGSETDAMEATLRDLGDIPASDSVSADLQDVRDEFVMTLEEYRGRFDAEARRLREIPELKDVKQFAKDLLEWREKTYRPALQQMLALSSIVHGKESLKTASTRIQKINAALRTLGLAGNRELRTLLEKAAKNLKDADALNAKALDLFLAIARPAPEPASGAPSADGANALPSSTSTAESASVSASESVLMPSLSATSTDTAAPATTEKKEPLPAPSDVAKESLLKIRDAYRLFSNVSDVVGRILR
ncbi:MAG: hypothetical protein UZ00_C0001G0031 [Parcubacteria group bacterium GW2011_GWA1_60_11]|nr:MAG: hypothetical protein UZ00_C0001G0031 [Parcubacteria group bacterium GW2011_GWA1_60_11]